MGLLAAKLFAATMSARIAFDRLYWMVSLLILSLLVAAPSFGQTAEQYRKQALELSRAKSWDEAIAAYHKALELNPKDPLTHYDLALAASNSSTACRGSPLYLSASARS